MDRERQTPMRLTPTRFAVASIVLTLGLFAVVHDDPARAFLEGGGATRLVALGTLVGAALVGVGLFQPSRLVSTVSVGVGIMMPAAFGIFGHAWCVMIVILALTGAEPGSLDLLAGRGFLESLRPLGAGALASGVSAGLAALATIRTGDARPSREAALVVIAAVAITNAFASMDFVDDLLSVSAGHTAAMQSSYRVAGASALAGTRLAIGGLVVVSALAIVVRSMGRKRSEPRGDLLLIGVLVTLIAGDVGITIWSSHSLARIVRTSFRAHLGSFHALRLDETPRLGRDLVVAPGAAFVGDARVPLSLAALERALRELAPLDDGDERTVAVAFDARVRGATLRLVLEAARRAGADAVELHGLAPAHDHEPDGRWSNPRLDHSFARVLLPMLGARTIRLVRPRDPEGRLDPASARIAVADRPTPIASRSPVGGSLPDAARPARVFQIALDDRATPRALVDTVQAIEENHDLAYVVQLYQPDPSPEVRPNGTLGIGDGR